jgi:microcin C transport system permease protein
MYQLNPLTIKKFRRFRSIKRGYWSAVILILLLFFAFFSELFINNRALIVYYNGEIYFPTYSSFIPATEFGLDYEYETNYRELDRIFQKENAGDWIIMPVVPYNAYENDIISGSFPPYPPSFDRKHYLGTDVSGRDILARLVYGFRIAMLFSLILIFFNYAVGIILGCLMGYWGGAFDLFFQRLIEIWSNIPFLYVIMIIASIIIPNFWTLILVMVIFGWMQMTWYMRTSTYKERERDYVLAAKALGASTPRIIINHILPNSISIVITFIPFSIASGITALTALDYLGFGLPAPTPSWGELLRQGTGNLHALWIVLSVVSALIIVLVMVTYIGEGIREVFDPKKHTTYE